jgi:hypothetical protein
MEVFEVMHILPVVPMVCSTDYHIYSSSLLNTLWVYNQTYFIWMSGNENYGNLCGVSNIPGVMHTSNVP